VAGDWRRYRLVCEAFLPRFSTKKTRELGVLAGLKFLGDSGFKPANTLRSFYATGRQGDATSAQPA
jgi:hypothetical protein